jgi:hypothetical protein
MVKKADGNIESMENLKRGLKLMWAGRQLRIEMIKAIFKSGRVEYHLVIPSKSTDNEKRKRIQHYTILWLKNSFDVLRKGEVSR